MRPIIFRGKRIDKKTWIYGRIVISNNVYVIYDELNPLSNTNSPVIEGTVGQFTGLNALNGMPIYEGDIVSVMLFDKMETGVVVYEYGCFCIDGAEGNDILCSYDVITVLGNIHDNPELIKKGVQ